METNDPIQEAIRSELAKHQFNESFADAQFREAAFMAALNKRLEAVKGALALEDGNLKVVRKDIPSITAVDAGYNDIEFSKLTKDIVETHKMNITRQIEVTLKQDPLANLPKVVQQQLATIDKELGINP